MRQRRTLLGMSQEKLGTAVGLTFQQIQKYERGSNRIGSSRLYEFAKVLDVPVSYFFDEMPSNALSGRPMSGRGRKGFGEEGDVLDAGAQGRQRQQERPCRLRQLVPWRQRRGPCQRRPEQRLCRPQPEQQPWHRQYQQRRHRPRASAAATVRSLNGNSCRVRYGDETRAVTLAKGETKRVH